MQAPRALAKSAIVEKVPIRPYFASREAWQKVHGTNFGDAKDYYGYRPRHWAIRFPALIPPGGEFDRKQAGEDLTAPQILIHNASEWDAVFRGGPSDKTKNGEHVGRYVRTLGKWLQQIERPGPPDGDYDYPGPPYHDGYLAFTCLKKRIRFEGGYGYRFVAQWAFEPALVERGSLLYLFYGISDDHTCQVLASFPIDCPGLPVEGPELAHLGYSMKNYAKLSHEFARYESAATRWLVRNAGQFSPSLETLDTMLASLDARTWQDAR